MVPTCRSLESSGGGKSAGRFECSAGYSELIDQFEVPPKLSAFDFAMEEQMILPEDGFHLVRTFVQEFDPEGRRACLNEGTEVIRAGLRAAVEDRVSASGIRLNGMFHSDPVPEGKFRRVAGATAVPEILAFGKKCAEQAMLHVEHWHVLMKGDLDFAGG